LGYVLKENYSSSKKVTSAFGRSDFFAGISFLLAVASRNEIK